MRVVIDWIVAHWALVSSVAVVLVWLANSLTRHFSGHAGLARTLTWISEMLSPLTSRDAPGWLKWPLTSVPPVIVDGRKKPPPVGLFMLLGAGLVSAALLGGCCTTSRCYLARGLTAVTACDRIAIPAIEAACKPKVAACGKVEPAKCPAYVACAKQLAIYQASMDAIGRGLGAANRSLADLGVP